MMSREWKTGMHKKGDRADINNYSEISIVPVPYKVLSESLQTRVVKQVDHQIWEYQANFSR